MTVEEFLKIVEEKAIKVERAEKSPLQGWGLNPPTKSADWFEHVQISDSYGCMSETCTHASHDPAAPYYAWVPRSNDIKVFSLGRVWKSESHSEYFVATDGDEVRVYVLQVPQYYHARIYRLDDLSELPDHLCREFQRLMKAQSED